MRRRSGLSTLSAVTVLTGLCAAVAPAGAQPPSGDTLIKPSILVDTTAVEPGKPFRAGILLSIEPGWHTYWQHPGDSGEPPRAEWSLPEGFSAGDLQFPTPIRFDVPGGLVNYGYKDAVMLIATITPPAKVETSSVEIAAAVTWLVCTDDVCLPGGGTVRTVVPIGPAAPAATDVFERWTRQLPVPPQQDANVKSTGNRPAAAPAPAFDEALEWAADVGEVDWFPLPPEGVELTGVSVNTDAGRTTITGAVRPYGGRAFTATEMRSVLAYTTAAGERRGVWVPVWLPSVGAAEKPPAAK